MLNGDGTISDDNTILDNLSMGVYLFNENGTLTYKNKIAATLPTQRFLKIKKHGVSTLKHKNQHFRVVRVKNENAILVTVEDITDSVIAEKKLKDAHKKMEEVLNRERKFLEEVSHYFFNPLCIAKGYLDLSIPSADPTLKRKLEITKQAVSRVENIVKHVVIEKRIYE